MSVLAVLVSLILLIMSPGYFLQQMFVSITWNCSKDITKVNRFTIFFLNNHGTSKKRWLRKNHCTALKKCPSDREDVQNTSTWRSINADMCEGAVEEKLITQEMCNKAMWFTTDSLFPNHFKTQETVLKLYWKIFITCNMILISTRSRRCATKQYIKTHTCWKMFLMNRRPEICVIKQ